MTVFFTGLTSQGACDVLISGLGTSSILATEFGDGSLYVGVSSGEIFRIFPVPEPSMILMLIAAGLMGPSINNQKRPINRDLESVEDVRIYGAGTTNRNPLES